MSDMLSMTLEQHGARYMPGAAQPILGELDELSSQLKQDQAGHRLDGNIIVRSLTQAGSLLHSIAREHIGPSARAVRAIFFNKTGNENWALGWHQDRTIAVVTRHEMAGFGPWTIKAGIPHVAPPIALLERMITMRIHLDSVPASNAPLLIVPGSHHWGLVAETDIPAMVARFGSTPCLAERGDIWLYSTPILHASDRSQDARSRRVLQLDFAADDLPSPLQWRGA